jgi:hypothetical protein
MALAMLPHPRQLCVVKAKKRSNITDAYAAFLLLSSGLFPARPSYIIEPSGSQ